MIHLYQMRVAPLLLAGIDRRLVLEGWEGEMTNERRKLGPEGCAESFVITTQLFLCEAESRIASWIDMGRSFVETGVTGKELQKIRGERSWVGSRSAARCGEILLCSAFGVDIGRHLFQNPGADCEATAFFTGLPAGFSHDR
jgi:hypothetical protein